MALRLDRLDRAAAAGAVNETNERDAQLVRHLLRHHLLLPDRGIRRAAAHREVIAADHDGAALDPSPPEDEVGGLERLDVFAIVAVLRAPRDRADLVEAAGIEQRIDALAHREAAGVVVALDLVRSAHAAGQLFAPAQFLDVGFPAHRPRSFPTL